MTNAFDLAAVEAGLVGTPLAGRVQHLETTDSTNTVALRAAQQGVLAGVWVADRQTAGRGRGGHAWHSSAGDGLYVSVLLRPHIRGADALKVSLAAGIACADAVGVACAARVDLRWPNDLLVADAGGAERKFGGILTESALDAADASLSYAVIGIGMNLNHQTMPEELRETATSLRLAGAAPVARESLLVALLPALLREVALVEREPESVLARFASRSTWVRGAHVHVAEQDGYTGVTDGLDRHGLLRVRLDDGTLRTVRHGGVRRTGVGGYCS